MACDGEGNVSGGDRGEPLDVKVLLHREEVLDRGKTRDTAVITCGLRGDWSLPMVSSCVCVCVPMGVLCEGLTSWRRNLLFKPWGRSSAVTSVCVPFDFSAHACVHMPLQCVSVSVCTAALLSLFSRAAA